MSKLNLLSGRADVKSSRKMGRYIANKSIISALHKYSSFFTVQSYYEDVLSDPHRLVSFDCSFIPDPDISRLASLRSIYKIPFPPFVGLTHTLSTPGALNLLPNLLNSALLPFDCLICTSQCAADSINYQLDFYIDQTSSKTHHASVKPSVRKLPLGLNISNIRSNLIPRALARKNLSLPSNAFVILWTGRLEQHCKSNHIPYLQVFKEINRVYPGVSLYFLVYGTSVMPNLIDSLKESASVVCPDTHVIFCDGDDVSLQSILVSASDVFLSLPDSFQETFGLTPIEAMASGLPVIGTDWNGYKDSIVSGQTGFLIPTLASNEFFRHNSLFESKCLNPETLDEASYYSANQISFDVRSLYQSLASFIDSPTLSLVMGDIAHKHVSSNYDWSSIIPLYDNVFTEMCEKSSSFDLQAFARPQPLNFTHPLFIDCFHSWPSDFTSSSSLYVINPSFSYVELVSYLDLSLLKIYQSIAPSRLCILAVYGSFTTASPMTFSQIAAKVTFSDELNRFSFPHELSRCLAFLLKYSFIQILSHA